MKQNFQIFATVFFLLVPIGADAFLEIEKKLPWRIIFSKENISHFDSVELIVEHFGSDEEIAFTQCVDANCKAPCNEQACDIALGTASCDIKSSRNQFWLGIDMDFGYFVSFRNLKETKQDDGSIVKFFSPSLIRIEDTDNDTVTVITERGTRARFILHTNGFGLDYKWKVLSESCPPGETFSREQNGNYCEPIYSFSGSVPSEAYCDQIMDEDNLSTKDNVACVALYDWHDGEPEIKYPRAAIEEFSNGWRVSLFSAMQCDTGGKTVTFPKKINDDNAFVEAF